VENQVAGVTTKGAIQNFTGGLAQLLADKGIRVNAVAPAPPGRRSYLVGGYQVEGLIRGDRAARNCSVFHKTLLIGIKLKRQSVSSRSSPPPENAGRPVSAPAHHGSRLCERLPYGTGPFS
jgi:NAD(P)-dependent dehydrogenase (short-subunit alcohol dehydrogenase family)